MDFQLIHYEFVFLSFGPIGSRGRSRQCLTFLVDLVLRNRNVLVTFRSAVDFDSLLKPASTYQSLSNFY